VSGSLAPTLDPYLFRIAATVRAGQTPAEVEAAVDREIEGAVEEPISQEALETAIKQAKAQFAYSSESVTNQGYWLGYSSVVAEAAWFDSFLGNLEGVTAGEVQRVAAEYLRRRNRTVGHYVGVGQAGGVANQEGLS
jgi:zinc protease